MAGSDRRARRPLQGQLVPADGFQDARRKGHPFAAHGLGAGVFGLELEGDPGRGEDADGGRRHLGADAVAGDEGDGVGHGISLPARLRPVRSAGALRACFFRMRSTSLGVSARCRTESSSSRTLPRGTTVLRSQSTRPSQYSVGPARITGKAFTFRVWIRVTASNSSSRVPKPPGRITNARLYFTNMTFRTKKYRKDSVRVR